MAVPKSRKSNNINGEGVTKNVVEADMVVSPLDDKSSISDALAEEHQISVESFRKGLWRFNCSRKKTTIIKKPT